MILLGKGTMTWKKLGAIYDGDWKDDHRCGFGTYSLPEGAGYRKVYSGGWKNDKRHVSIYFFHSMQRTIFPMFVVSSKRRIGFLQRPHTFVCWPTQIPSCCCEFTASQRKANKSVRGHCTKLQAHSMVW